MTTYPYWEQPFPQLEEYGDGYIGCTACGWACSHRLRGVELLQQWRAHLNTHRRGAQ